MQRSNTKWILPLATLVGLTMGGCKKDKDVSPAPGGGGGTPITSQIALSFDFRKGTEPFALGGTVVDADGRLVRITKLRFFLSGIEAENDEGEVIGDYEGVYILADASSDAEFALGTISGNHVHQLHFNLGVDSATNHTDMTTFTEPPLNDPTATWMWNQDFGYKFIDIEGDFDADNNGTVDPGEGSFQAHIAGDDLLTPGHAHVHADLVAGGTFVAPIVVDVEGLFSGVQMTGAMHMDLLGTTPRTTQIMLNLAAGIDGPE
ncbi:MAG TPA: MbnP family protein [Flavobacteriales bacterium]